MRIESSVISLASKREAMQQDFIQRKVSLLGEGEKEEKNRAKTPAITLDLNSPRDEGSGLTVSRGQGPQLPDAVEVSKEGLEKGAEDPAEKRFRMMKHVLEMLTGKKITLTDVEEGVKPEENEELERLGDRRVLVEETRTHIEEEATSFDASGVIKTRDGRELSFSLFLEMERRVEIHTKEVYETTANLVDPLVVNFDGTAAELSDMKFSFDLDADGTEEEISSLAGGSGFLAIDNDGDGRIGDGSELFGTRTGDGFRELAHYDADGDGWIDEDDPIFSQLKVWTRDSFGNDRLTGLLEADVGAISLANASTNFDLKDEENSLNGRIRSTGVYAKESGGMSTIQHLDIAT